MAGQLSYDETDPSETMKPEFQAFLSQHYSSASFLYVVVGSVLYNLAAFHDPGDYTMCPFKSLVENLQISLRLVVLVCPILIWLLKKDGRDVRADKNDESPYLLSIQTLYPILFSFSLAKEALSELPGPGRDVRYQALFGMMFFPFTVFFLLRDTHMVSMLVAWASSVFILASAWYFAPSWDFFACFVTYVLVSAFIFNDWTKQTKRMFMLVKKLQDTVKLNEQLAVEAQALELRAMIGNVAHDLKTPLTSLSTGIELMHEIMTAWKPLFVSQAPKLPGDLVGKVANNFKSIFDCLNSMQGTNSFMIMTINRCLDYTKASKGFKLVPKLETVSLQAALEMPVQLMRDVQDSIEIEVLPLRAEVCVHAITDKQWLIENLLCLLSNAVKYSHKGRVQVSVKLEKSMDESVETDSFLRFEVQDTGVGLSDEAMQGLFNPFKQAQRLAGGTGLGLFSLANRVEALQGKYGVKHRPDGEQGSLFWFTIPFRADELSDKGTFLVRSDSDQASGSAPTAAVPGAGPVNSLQHYNVLVVDDAPLIVKMTTMLLQRKGHTVHHATNGAHALEKLLVRSESADSSDTSSSEGETSPHSTSWMMPAEPLFDVVLMDLQMPVLDGIEAVRRLRAAEARRDALAAPARASSTALSASDDTETPDLSVSPPRQFVIALSANSDEETRQEALAAGADMFLPKPFTYENFLDVINSRTN